MGWAQFSTCVDQTSGHDISTMTNIGEDLLRHIAQVWSELGPVTKALIEGLGETLGVFLAAFFGEEAAEALLDLGLGAALARRCLGRLRELRRHALRRSNPADLIAA